MVDSGFVLKCIKRNNKDEREGRVLTVQDLLLSCCTTFNSLSYKLQTCYGKTKKGLACLLRQKI